MVKYSATLDDVFGALSDPVRRHIVERLARGEHTAGALATNFSISQPAVSKHLKVLERCGLIKRRIVGREHHLRLAPRAMITAADWIGRQRAFWNASFDRLGDLLESATSASALVIRRTFDASRERVFAAWTDSKLVSAWFGPGMVVNNVAYDVRVGGNYRIEMTSPDGEAFNVGGTFSEVRAPERLAFTFRWEEDSPELERDTLVSIDFIDRSGKTEMIFNQERFASEASRSNHERGWNEAFERLERSLHERTTS